MKKGFSTFLVILLVLFLGCVVMMVRFIGGGPEDSWICSNGQWVKHGNPSSSKPTTDCSSAVSTNRPTINITAKIEPSKTTPLPTGEDIVRTFFELIKEKRITEAIRMMTKNNREDDSTKQAWGVQFNNFESIKLDEINPHNKEEWTTDKETYKVMLTVQMRPESASAPIPYYGWDNGKNTRWVEINKEGGLWKVVGIATGP